MLAADRQIVEMYETLEFSPELIARETGWSLEAIKMSLLTNSTLFSNRSRAESKQIGGGGASQPGTIGGESQETIEYPLFTEQDEKACRDILVDLAKGAELEIVRASCAKAVVKLNSEERKSKRLTLIGKTTNNIVIIQERLDRARRATQLESIEVPGIPVKELQPT